MAPKMRFYRFRQKSNPLMSTFLLEYESYQWSPHFLHKLHVWEKLNSWVMVQKPLDQSECRILWSTISRKRVGLWSRIFVNKCTQSFQLRMIRNVWAWPKGCPIVSQLYLKSELDYKVGFLHVVLQIYSIISSGCGQVDQKESTWLNRPSS